MHSIYRAQSNWGGGEGGEPKSGMSHVSIREQIPRPMCVSGANLGPNPHLSPKAAGLSWGTAKPASQDSWTPTPGTGPCARWEKGQGTCLMQERQNEKAHFGGQVFNQLWKNE